MEKELVVVVIPINWVRFLSVYFIKFTSPLSSTSARDPDVGKSTVESTSRILAPTLTSLRSFVFELGSNLP